MNTFPLASQFAVHPGRTTAQQYNDMASALNAVAATLDAAEQGEYATKGRDFGRGVAFLAAEIRAVIVVPTSSGGTV